MLTPLVLLFIVFTVIGLAALFYYLNEAWKENEQESLNVKIEKGKPDAQTMVDNMLANIILQKNVANDLYFSEEKKNSFKGEVLEEFKSFG